MTPSYCVKCKKQTSNVDEKYDTSENGKLMLKSTCVICGSKKSKFVKAEKGGKVDIHKNILKVAPKNRFVLPGHNYTGPGNPLESQLKYNPDTGEILEIYQQPAGKTDAISM